MGYSNCYRDTIRVIEAADHFAPVNTSAAQKHIHKYPRCVQVRRRITRTFDFVSFVLMADCDWYELVHVDGRGAKMGCDRREPPARRSTCNEEQKRD